MPINTVNLKGHIFSNVIDTYLKKSRLTLIIRKSKLLYNDLFFQVKIGK